jgi:hypothetical protein
MMNVKRIVKKNHLIRVQHLLRRLQVQCGVAQAVGKSGGPD